MFIYPKLQDLELPFGDLVASDLLIRALLDKVGLKAELIYANDWYSIT